MTLAFDVAIGSAAATLFTAPSDADRRAALATLAAAGPAVRIPLPGGNTGWLVTGYAHVRAVLTDPHVVKQLGLFGGPFTDELPAGVAAGLFRHMLNANPPDHGRLRRLVAAAFTRRRVEAMAPRIQQLTDAFLDAVPADGPVDLVEALAAPLPVRVIGDLLGVPEADFPRYAANLGLTERFDPVTNADVSSIVNSLRGFAGQKWFNPPYADRTTYLKHKRGDDYFEVLWYSEGFVYFVAISS